MTRWIPVGVLALSVITGLALGVFATDAVLYFSYDKNGQERVTTVQEGAEIWIVVLDNDQNIDCDIRDKMSPDLKLMDPKTGAYLIWHRNPDFDAGNILPTDDYLEETGPDTGVFVSRRAFQLGTREDFSVQPLNTHVVDVASSPPDDFRWGSYVYLDIQQEDSPLKDLPSVAGDSLRWVGSGLDSPVAYNVGFIGLTDADAVLPSELDQGRILTPSRWLLGRFENMDTLVGMYQDPNDASDVALGLMKIIDVEATIDWDREVYRDANEAATLTVRDADENLDCNQVEVVPVFIIVNPGSWNPAGTSAVETDQTHTSPNNFCMLKRTGGVNAADPDPATNVGDYRPIRWFNIYNSEKNDYETAGAQDGRYYMQYPKLGLSDVAIHKTLFDTISDDGITAVSFYAQETGVNTGVFQLNLNSILDDLGFRALSPRDVLVAYYLDPNDEDDFKLATAYVEERQHSLISFTDASRDARDAFGIGRDAVYVQVIDANANVDPCCPESVIVHVCDPHEEDDGEFWVLHETSSNSPVFFSTSGMELKSTWDALGVGLAGMIGGYQLVLDNWKLEVFNEDDVYVRYNDVQYMAGDNGYAGLADSDTTTAYSGPRIDRVRVSNDVSFALMSITDTQVYDGVTANMRFLDRQGNRVSGYVNSDCVFVEVTDLDQDEDPYRRERVDAYWDGGQNYPFGPLPRNAFGCAYSRDLRHPVNDLLGDTNIFGDSPNPYLNREDGAAKIYVLNPRTGRWAGVDLLETGVGTGTFVSVICIDLSSVYECVPTLGALPGDTILAVYQDPSNHSDSSWISIKVAVGGGSMPADQQSTTQFVDEDGVEVVSYSDADEVYVRVVDASHAGATGLSGCLLVEGATYDLHPLGTGGTFMTDALPIPLAAGQTLTATYTDPANPMDVSSDTVAVVSSALSVERFYAAPNPFDSEVTFAYVGTGTATHMIVDIYDVSGRWLWTIEGSDVSELTWDGTIGARCLAVANGAYLFVVSATDGTNAFTETGRVFVNR